MYFTMEYTKIKFLGLIYINLLNSSNKLANLMILLKLIWLNIWIRKLTNI